MAGMTSAGFSTKRLTDIIEEQNSNAETIFQDLVPVGDTVDTSSSSTIGRIIGLTSAQFADLWEALQEVYSAMDPNSSYGVALDNLVALNGTVRIAASPTTTDIVVWSNNGIIIPEGSLLSATNGDTYQTGDEYTVVIDTCIGAQLTLDNIVVGDGYSVQITVDEQTTTALVTAQEGDTIASVLSSLQAQMASTPYISQTVSGNTLTIQSQDIYKTYDFDVGGVVATQVKSRMNVSNTENGVLPLASNTVTSFSSPINGIVSVTNPFPGVVGTDQETDEDLRTRFSNNKYRSAANINESLYSALIDIVGVKSVRVYENNTDDYVATYDLPGHSFKAVVLGGLDTDISKAIWINQPIGIGSEGNTSYTVTDSQNFPQVVKWDRPSLIPIYISVDIGATEQDNIPSNAASAIKSSLVNYFSKLTFGEDVIQSRLYTPVNETQDFQINHIYLGTSPSPTSTNNISIAYNALASLTTDNISVTITN